MIFTMYSIHIIIFAFTTTNINVVNAFHPLLLVQSSHTLNPRTRLFSLPQSSSLPSSDRIKKAGCGIPVVPSGDCLLFNPEEEGKLQGTGSLSSRIHSAHNYILPKDATLYGSGTCTKINTPPDGVTIYEAQNWLEQYTSTNLPPLFAKPSSPTTATILAKTRLITPSTPGDIQHIILQLPPNFHYMEGQSLSVIPPGLDRDTNKKYKPRLYSIASTRYGDIINGSTVSLCVRRAEYYDPITGIKDDSKKGVCSNYLCDAEVGTEVTVAGPIGKTMLLPDEESNDVWNGALKKDLIMIATGTGIAPFRAFLHRLFMEQTVVRHMYEGEAWLVLGVRTTGGLLYKDELDAMVINGQGQLKVDYAISREMSNPDGSKVYVQHILQQQSTTFFDKLNNGAVVYFCGLKNMMPDILKTLENVAVDKGLDWNIKLKEWKENGQWHVEVY